MRENITKAEILRKRSDIQALFKSRKSFRINALQIKARPNGLGYCRLLVAPLKGKKKIGSVLRNTLRRIGRELYRRNRALLSGYSYDIVLFVGAHTLTIPFEKRCAHWRSLLSRLK